jgi:ketosteroid isomerase-like protein
MTTTIKNSTSQLAETFLIAMVERDAGTLENIVADDVVWHVPPSAMPQFGGPHFGKQGVVALVAGAGGTLFVEGTQKLHIVNLVAEDGKAGVLFRMTARTTSGIDYDNLYSFFFRCELNKIAEIWELVDTGYLYGLLNIDPAWVRSPK